MVYKKYLIGVGISIILSLLSYYTIRLFAVFLEQIPGYLFWIAVLLMVIISFLGAVPRGYENNSEPPTFILLPFLTIISVLSLLWALPAFFIITFLNPEMYKQAIKLSALLLGIGSAILYYYANIEKFKISTNTAFGL